jgi:hypothetical protein
LSGCQEALAAQSDRLPESAREKLRNAFFLEK